MKIPVLLEPVGEKRYRASCGAPFVCTAEGDTPHQAYKNLEQQILARIRAGASLASLDVPLVENGALSFGIFSADDPVVQEWLQIIEENRRKADEEPDLPP
jgi:hypothetical protein